MSPPTTASPAHDAAQRMAHSAEYELAEKQVRIRVKSLRSLYLACAVFVVVNLALWVINFIQQREFWAGWITLWWGVGLACWALRLYFDGHGFTFGTAWEEQKVQTLMARANLKRVSSEKVLVQSQLRLLQAQIEPHFLFNTLANVQSLIKREPATAQLMLDTFITYLRSSLVASRAPGGTLEQELDLLRNYLDLLKIRMGARLTYVLDVPSELHNLALSSMLLQPLVENAVRHGLEPKVDGGHLQLTARKIDTRLHVSIADNGLGFAPESVNMGVGLSNLRERLQVLFDGRASLDIVDLNPGTEVRLVMPV